MLGAWLLLQLAAADGEGLRLEWSAPPGCPQAEQVRARLAGHAGRAAVTVTGAEAQWKLVVRIEDSVRELTTRSCDEAADAAVLIIQLALAPPARAAAPAPPPAWVVRAGLVGGATLGWVPKALAQLGVSASVSLASLALTLDVRTALPVRFAGGPVDGAAVTLHQALDAQVGVCWLFDAGPARVGPCAHGALGVLLVRGENVSAPRSTSLALLAGGPGVRATVRLVSWLELLAAAVWRFGTRPSVSFEGGPPVVEAGPASLDLFGGLSARF